MADVDHSPDASDSDFDPTRSRPVPGPQDGSGGSGRDGGGGGGRHAAQGGAGDGDLQQLSSTRTPGAQSVDFVNPVRILSYAPTHGAPGTFVDVSVQVSALEHQEWRLNCLVGLDGFDLWSEAFHLPSHGPGALLIRAVIPDFVAQPTVQPLSLRIYDDSGQTLCTIPFGIFSVTPRSTGRAISRPLSSRDDDNDDVEHAASSVPSRHAQQWEDIIGDTSSGLTGTDDLFDASAESAFASASQRFPMGFPLASQSAATAAADSHTEVASRQEPWQSSRRYRMPSQRPVLLAPRFEQVSDAQPGQLHLPTGGGGGGGGSGSSSSNLHPAPDSFNPYSIYPNRAILNIQGDLGAVAESWTVQELDFGRRVVAFRRKQSGRTISISFSVVPEGHRDADSFSVSCLWWSERQQAFITSVDTIHLLQSIMNIRFTVEEKNRIRRNLEGFHPLTVSKTKPECESFFALVMGLPEPKPRNIEKDVKIFDWAKLEPALKKIVSKYSASPSSTAGLLNPEPSMSDAGASSSKDAASDET